jgi:hypothetical protein
LPPVLLPEKLATRRSRGNVFMATKNLRKATAEMCKVTLQTSQTDLLPMTFVVGVGMAPASHVKKNQMFWLGVGAQFYRD